MPALAASQEMQERAAHLGYDWPSIDGILGKVAEELGELAAAEGSAARAEELGDLLMVVVNLARHHDVEAEAALRAANDKFRRRFGIVERLAAERGVALRDLSFAELDELWDAAKAEIAAAAQAELPATAAQAELPATAAQAELPATAAQAELPATAAQAELPAAAPARDNGPQEVPR
jgi:NTP pyrophosphatase (non-canonical NTP hydrolase)